MCAACERIIPTHAVLFFEYELCIDKFLQFYKKLNKSAEFQIVFFIFAADYKECFFD